MSAEFRSALRAPPPAGEDYRSEATCDYVLQDYLQVKVVL